MHRAWKIGFLKVYTWIRHDLASINGCDMEVVQGQGALSLPTFGKLGNAQSLQLSPNCKFSFCTGTQYI